MYRLRATALADASVAVTRAAGEQIPVPQIAGVRGARHVRHLTATGAGTLITDEIEWPGRSGWLGRQRDDWQHRPRVLAALAAHLTEVTQAAELAARAEVKVVAAALIRDGRVLAAQRAEPPELAGFWEFPGGKVEDGETEVAALARECAEELGVVVAVGGFLGEVTSTHKYGSAAIRLWSARLDPTWQDVVAVEHLDLRWLVAADLDSVDWLTGNRPLLEAVRGVLSP